MAKVLKLKFKNAKGKTKILSIARPKEGLDAETVKAAMDKIVASSVFEKDDEKLYVKPIKAYYTTTTEDDIFEVEEDEENAE